MAINNISTTISTTIIFTTITISAATNNHHHNHHHHHHHHHHHDDQHQQHSHHLAVLRQVERQQLGVHQLRGIKTKSSLRLRSKELKSHLPLALHEGIAQGVGNTGAALQRDVRQQQQRGSLLLDLIACISVWSHKYNTK